MNDTHPTTREQCANVLADVGARWASVGRLPATSGNLSLRLGNGSCVITASGRDKGRLRPEDLITVRLEANPDERQTRSSPPGTGTTAEATSTNEPCSDARPSAELELHTRIYRRYPEVRAVFHTHSMAATVLSRLAVGQRALVFEGYEIIKAFRGLSEADARLTVPLFDNDPDIARLAARVDDYMQHSEVPCLGYLIRAHGSYSWGNSVPEAVRHADALEYLMACELEFLRLGGT